MTKKWTRLTDESVASAPTRDRRYERPDGDGGLVGFYLSIQPSGHRSFVLRYRNSDGKPCKLTIGPGTMPVAEARKRARVAVGEIAKGGDPAAAKRAVRAAKVIPGDAPRTIGELIDLFLKERPRPKRRKREARESTWQSYSCALRKDVTPLWKDRRLDAITSDHVAALLDAVAKGRPSAANRIYIVLGRLFAWGVSKKWLKISPVTDDVVMPSEVTKRDRTLKNYELRLVLGAADTLPPQESAFVNLLLLTAARRNEVAHMEWAEIDENERLWHLPAHRTKNGHAHDLPLSDAALAILASLPRDGAFVLPHSGGTGPISDFSRLKKHLDAAITALNGGASIAEWRFHDLRRTVTSRLPDLNVSQETAERLLNHIGESFSGVAGVYQRHDYQRQMRHAVDALADHLTALRADNVITLPTARRS